MKTYWKSALALLLTIIVGCTSANAQFRWGVKAGVNLNNLKLQDFPSNFTDDNGCGFTGGVMTEFQVPIVGLCLDASLMYTRMSASSDIYTSAEGFGQAVKSTSPNKDFLEVPINLKYKFPIPMVQPYLFTGPSFAFKLGGDDDVFKTKTFQCAWNIGVGVELLSHVQISGSYGFGVNNIMESMAGVQTSDNIKLKNNYWTITAAYLF